MADTLSDMLTLIEQECDLVRAEAASLRLQLSEIHDHAEAMQSIFMLQRRLIEARRKLESAVRVRISEAFEGTATRLDDRFNRIEKRLDVLIKALEPM